MTKVALVHDWLTGYRGGEKCLTYFLKLYPDADIFTLLHVPGSTTPQIDSRVRQASFFQKIPFAKNRYRYLLPLFPTAIKQLNLNGYDLIISLSHAASKNVAVPKGAVHLCYCFTPMRYIWDQSQEYLGKLAKPAWPLIQWLRNWDLEGSRSVNRFVPISRFIEARIRRFYGRRDSVVLYPPTDISWVQRAAENEQGEAFLSFGALVQYKRVDHAIIACKKLGVKLWVAGDGPDRQRLEKIRDGDKNIIFMGRVSDDELAGLYRKARALIFPGTEDFGLVPIECMASGRPVIASYSGGAKESMEHTLPITNPKRAVIESPTGVFFNPRTGDRIEALVNALEHFINHEGSFTRQDCISRAEQFSPEVFLKGWKEIVKTV